MEKISSKQRLEQSLEKLEKMYVKKLVENELLKLKLEYLEINNKGE